MSFLDFRPAFDALDADRDGRISSEDLKSAGAVISSGEIGSMISAADTDRNGYVEFKEFEDMLMVKSKARNDGVMEEVFRVMDLDGDGKVGFHDLKVFLQSARIFVSDEEIKYMIKMGGADETDGVSFQTLLNILAGN
ncbi:hypothetical protein ZOSMA_3G00170 [Zostera marina]|uniref:EF-hand domain-containing protein n=1 Tax=Zostera marina TaxID=29655 RepID=A0A0K9P5P4_ZOSMR|nr:hypothetical protein ZOSMA_3G00170 [Zostera marina]